MRRLIKRSTNTGYKGMAKIARQLSEPLQTSDMNNPFIGDNFFLANPDKVLGVQTIEKGRYNSDMIVVKGTIDDIQKIDAPALPLPDFYPQQNFSVITKEQAIEEVFKNEIEGIATREIKRRRSKKDVAVSPIASSRDTQEYYSFREIGEMYNKEISRDELEAYYFSHPELNYSLLFDDYTNTKDDLVRKNLLCWDEGRLVYVHTYQSGNVSRKISHLQRDAGKIIELFGQAQYDKQLAMLNEVKPKNKSLVGEDRLTLLPHSSFAKEFKITQFRFGEPALNGEVSLFDAYRRWLRNAPADYFEKSTYFEIIKYYLDNESIPVYDGNDKVRKEKEEKNAINTRQRTKEEGDRLFAKMLAEDLLPEDQSRLTFIWNEKFNAWVEPNLTKIPVCFQISKTFKANYPLMLNATQRQSAAFYMEKKSGLLAYGVGVGKTLASIVCAAQAFYNNLAKKMVFVVPTNTYDKWIGEIQGYMDNESGKYMHGALPQMPPVVGLFNLNPVIVRNEIKEYSAQDENTFDRIERAIDAAKKIKEEDFTPEQKLAIATIYPINWAGIEFEYAAYVGNSKAKRLKTRPEFVADYLKNEYNYMVYELGRIKNYPDGTIFVTTEVGIQRLAVGESNQGWLSGNLFEILSQGEKSAMMDDRDEKKIAKLELKIQQIVASSQKNAKLKIEDFGFDFVCYDEAHLYKKLFTIVKGQVTGEKAYGPNQGDVKRDKSKYEIKSGAYPSSRALSAYALSYFIQRNNDNRNVLMLTATPFTNSPLEVFSMLTMTNYQALQDAGLGNMTDFFDTFMRINYDIKYTPQKKVVKDVVLTGYNNLPQLRTLIYSIMDKKDEGANLKRPTKHVWPSLQKGIETTIPMTAEQEALMLEVKAYINGKTDLGVVCGLGLQDEIEALDLNDLDDEALILEWERATENEFEGEREDLPEARRESMIKQIKNAKSGGTELDEADLDSDESLGVRTLRGISMMRQITLSPYLYYKACQKAANQAIQMPTYKDYIHSSPKLKYVIGCCKSIIDFHKKRNEKISGQVIYMNAGVEYFGLIKEYFVREIGLRESQVGIVSGSMSKSAKETVKKGFLSGDILILIGSSTISVGVDLQNNSTALYNCYYDWNPTDAAQIEGRIWRQGNRFANVRIVYPQCYNSADPVIFEYLNQKTLRINEIWNRSSQIQELDLRDFDPKQLQRKLITDPEELADWEILEQTDSIRNEIIFYENRMETLASAMRSYFTFKNDKQGIIDSMKEVAAAYFNDKRRKAIAEQEEKEQNIRLENRDNPEKANKEIEKYIRDRYNHTLDPDGRYVLPDFDTMTNAELGRQAKKWGDLVNNLTYRESDAYGKIFYNRTYISEKIYNLYYLNNDMVRAEERLLRPLGISFETAENPQEQFNEKIVSLRTQLDAIEESRADKVMRYTIEMNQRRATIKTVEDRIAEFASFNESLIPPQLHMEQSVVEIPLPKVPEKPQDDELMRLNEIAQASNNRIVIARMPKIEFVEPAIETPEVEVVDMPKPKKKPAAVKAAPEPAEKSESNRDIIEKRIKALHLAKNYSSPGEQKKIDKLIKALTITLNFI